jgi:HD superfamily phosphohydrolase
VEHSGMSRVDAAQRIRDPIHGLIEFHNEDEMLVWKLIQCPEFQRLRRIKQLGFSELVYPGATHTRFSHSVGVFHNARRLLGIVEDRLNKKDADRTRVALCAALLHDVGHGPFSHVFESALKELGRHKKHEQWTAEIATGDTGVNEVLKAADKNLPEKIAKVIRSKEPEDLYAAVVSSQFDADRLDYLRRDRYMTGIKIGDFDMDWLLDCLEVGEVILDEPADKERVATDVSVKTDSAVGLPPAGPIEVQGFVLNQKAWSAAEGYLEARYQLYGSVYYHKTTRAAEVVLRVFLRELAERLKSVEADKLGLWPKDPLVVFLSTDEPTLAQYLALDDVAVAHFLAGAATSITDEFLRDLASRLVTRRLFKAVDLDRKEGREASDWALRFDRTLRRKAEELGLKYGTTLVARFIEFAMTL